jgi:hypothetical protein
MSFDDFVALIIADETLGGADLDRLYDQLIAQGGRNSLDDDFSVMRFAF